MIVFKIEIPGKPIQKNRPRFSLKGKHPRPYSDQKKESSCLKTELKLKYKGDLLTCPLCIDFEFVFNRPKDHYGTGKNSKKLKRSAPVFHIKKPDKDNLEKFVLDCMEGIVFKNDSQVWAGHTQKRYAAEGEEAKTIISIYKGERCEEK